MRESDSIRENVVECRPKPVTFWGGAFLLCFAIGMFVLYKATSQSSKPIELGFLLLGLAELLFCAGTGVYMMAHTLFTRVTADNQGLRWRGIQHGWRSVVWHDVGDYYDENRRLRATEARTVCAPTIDTSGGIIRVPGDCTNLTELRDITREQATSARVSDWLPFGVRRVDEWPQKFRYWNETLPRKIAAEAGLAVLFFGALGYGFLRIIHWFSSRISAADVQPVVLALLLGYLALLSLPVLKAGHHYRMWKRRGEEFTATPETLRYQNTKTGENREVSWAEISDYFYGFRSGGLKHEGFTLVLRGAGEKTFWWSPALLQAERLLAIVQTYAPEPAFMKEKTPSWRSRGKHEKTGGSDPAMWQGGSVGMGGRVFHNRDASGSLVAALLSLFPLFLIGMCVSEWVQPGAKDERIFALVMTIGFVLPMIWWWVCYFRTRVETDDMGITHYTPFGKRFLPWFAVADYTDVCDKTNPRMASKNISFLSIVTGRDGKRMFFWSTLNGYEELRAEIERYAPPPKTGWKTQKAG